MKYFLVFVDILGFEEGAEEEAKLVMRPTEYVRATWRRLIEDKLSELSSSGTLVKYEQFQLDQWLLVMKDLPEVFMGINELLVLNLKLEIAIGVEELPEFRPSNLSLLTNEMVASLKNERKAVINHYHTWYKRTYNDHNKGPKTTFVVLTDSAYNELDPLDKKRCEKTRYTNAKAKTINLFIVAVNEVRQRAKVFRFLKKIGIPGSRRYDRIDDLYVPPLEYEEIKETLKRNRIIFLCGTQEYGKTYTAIRLLWEYFLEGYEPIWVPGEEEREREEVRRRFEEIARELKSHRIIYFEDPFGLSKYESRKNLERIIDTIILEVDNVKDSYVIITSREEAFKKFIREQTTSLVVEQFEKKLDIRKPSYNYEKKREILLRWAEARGCKWLEDGRLKDLVLKNLDKKGILPTPLSIREFATSTVRMETWRELRKEIIRKSKAIAESFAKDIEDMSDDKILFLSFVFVSNLSVDVLRREYKRLIYELKVEHCQTFDEVLNWFKDDKIQVKDGEVMFSHPSYEEAMSHLLVNKGQFTRINEEIISKVLLRLSEKNEVTVSVVFFVMNYFKQLPEKVTSESLLRVSKRKGMAFVMAPFLTSGYRLLPSRVRSLLFKFAGRRHGAEFVALAVAADYNKLPKKARNLLFEIAAREDLAPDVISSIAAYYNRLPRPVRRLLFKLSRTYRGALHLAFALNSSFDKFPKNDRKMLLLMLLEKEESIRETASVPVITHFDKFTKTDAKLLLDKVLENDETAKHVVFSLLFNTYIFPRLPPKNRKWLLLELSERTETLVHVASFLGEASNLLPKDIREKLLLNLAARLETKPFVISILGDHFDSFSQALMDKLLLALMENDEIGAYASLVLASSYDKLSQSQKELFFRLSQEKKTVLAVVLAIAQYFDKLPENVRNMLDSLQDSLRSVLESLSGSADTSARLKAIELISNTLSKINDDFARVILGKLVLDANEEVRTKAIKVLASIQ